MLNKLLRKYRTWRFAKTQKKDVLKKGTLLNAFYHSKTIFIHIPKTAGVSLLKSIYGDVTLSGHRSFYFNSIVLDTKNYKYFSFAFVRNPFDRLYSTYMFLKRGGMNCHDKRAFANRLSKFEDFEDFVLNGLDKKLIFEITHLIPQHDYICDLKGNILVDFIGRFEKLDDDIELLSKRLNKNLKLDHYNFNNKRSYLEVYSQVMIDKVSKVYQKDIDIFGYNFK